MSSLFGTDGVRGLANGLITAELSVKLAQAAAVVLGHRNVPEGTRPKAVIARDPRASGEFISAAMSAGLASAGVDVFDAGVIPTPAAAYLVADLSADFGVMISASHNPADDNGIKFLAFGGHKLSDALEYQIEAELAQLSPRPIGAGVGRIQRFADAEDRYVAHLLTSLPCRIDGLTVVLDCANGAASTCSPRVFKDAGAHVIVIGADPDGLNINDGYGSTHLEKLQAAVMAHRADLGIAHDGDADRCLAVDNLGRIVDGDEIMAIMAVALESAGKLTGNTLVATVMSNLGLKRGMEKAGISVKETAVGDRYVLEGMREGSFSLGGEQSGHVIFADFATTGDGVLTGLQLAAEMSRSGKSLSELASVMTRMPQVLINVKGVDKLRAATDAIIQDTVRVATATLGDNGRVLLRPSGTEPVVRIMVEAAELDVAQRIAEQIADAVLLHARVEKPLALSVLA
ncbi:phosphoglucosamine mutase [Arthrobacter sp. PAMC25564]|uniref:phosphoglucosamine mutase n=1 Tax=Arthrobacter sp. PAMC25564 TaxID=2565366 RepID=UPI0010A23ADD|nr:phosphoglucosamine mutase [Arthrobacter sp. PAMC25564]QCB96562.1 phosphoglucosamine mutase [Arthrobacter sp. PAMC25564]